MEPDKFPSFGNYSNESLRWRETKVEFANMRRTYMISVPKLFVCKNVLLFVFVLSRPASFDIRKAIRASWAAKLPQAILLRFVIGRSKNISIIQELLEEHRHYGDLIFCDMDDIYEKLYLKVHAGFQWQKNFCSEAKLILKIDDDTVIDFERLLYWMHNKMLPLLRQNPTVLFGFCWYGAGVDRDKFHKYYLPYDQYPLSHFPPYMSGPSYFLSNQAVSTILRTTKKVKVIPIEDILYTGVIAHMAGIHKVNMRKHFETIKLESQTEKACEGDIPLLITTAASASPEQIVSTYKYLKDIRCKQSTLDLSWLGDTIYSINCKLKEVNFWWINLFSPFFNISL